MRIAKKGMALLAALALMFTLTSALAADYSVSGLFSITYDDSVFTLDDTSCQSQNTNTYRWLFLLSASEHLVDVSTELIEGYESLTLATATEDERQAYLNDTLDSFSEDSATYLEMVEVNGTPFYMYQMEDGEGPYLLAETIVNGCSIDFFAYYDNAEHSADEALMAMLTELLSTFEPTAQGV